MLWEARLAVGKQDEALVRALMAQLEPGIWRSSCTHGVIELNSTLTTFVCPVNLEQKERYLMKSPLTYFSRIIALAVLLSLALLAVVLGLRVAVAVDLLP